MLAAVSMGSIRSIRRGSVTIFLKSRRQASIAQLVACATHSLAIRNDFCWAVQSPAFSQIASWIVPMFRATAPKATRQTAVVMMVRTPKPVPAKPEELTRFAGGDFVALDGGPTVLSGLRVSGAETEPVTAQSPPAPSRGDIWRKRHGRSTGNMASYRSRRPAPGRMLRAEERPRWPALDADPRGTFSSCRPPAKVHDNDGSMVFRLEKTWH